MLYLLIPGLAALGLAIFLAVRDWRKTGSREGLWTVVGIPLALVACLALSVAMGGLSEALPYWLRATLAVIFLGAAFGYGFAYLAAQAVLQTKRRGAWSYLVYVGVPVYAAYCLALVYGFFIDVLVAGWKGFGEHTLPTGLLWLSVALGWALTPFFLRWRLGESSDVSR